MAYKPSLRHLHRKCQLPQQGQRPAIERYQSVEMGPFPRVTKETGCLSVLDDHRLYPQALGEMLESDNYEVALVPRGEWVHIQGSQVEPSSTAARAVLGGGGGGGGGGGICESVRDSNPS